MRPTPFRRRIRFSLLLVFALALAAEQASIPPAWDANLTPEQIKTFLRTAKVVKEKESSKGITHPARLTLSDGTLTHDASFQTVDEHRPMLDIGNGQMEMNFVDSYKYNIAAYELASLVGLDDLVPVYVERNWQGKTGSLGWWLPVKMDEADRVAKKIQVPEDMRGKWNNQMYKIRVFDQLVYDSDPNMTNVLIGDDWKIWRVDFSRAFRLLKEPREYKNLDHCDRDLLQKLKALDANEFTERTKKYLTKSEITAVMARRDKIVQYIQKLIAEKGEAQVLY
ncbi:MAG: hypothetical protein ACXVZV_11400 [Terriglobales bacterium]